MKNRYVRWAAAATVTLGLVLMTMSVFSGTDPTYLKPKTTAEFAKSTVRILNPDATSGGTGVILRSSQSGSLILTNKHICQLIQIGGIVQSAQGSARVASYKPYPDHDLCLISVRKNLQVNTYFAKQDATAYSDVAVAGHPALLPLVVSRGHISDKLDINLVVGTEACTGEEQDEADMFYCFIFGKKPKFKKMQAQVVTALIMPGSSGSAVFNSQGEIEGMVFAGAGDLGYGLIVPYVFLQDFLTNESRYEWHKPSASNKKDLFAGISHLQEICQSKTPQCYVPGVVVNE